MPADPCTIPARLLIDPDALAALHGEGVTVTPSEVVALLERVSVLLADVRDRLGSNDSILVDQATAAKLLSCSAQSLKNWNVPAVKLSGRRMYRRSALEQWAAERETAAGETVGAR